MLDEEGSQTVKQWRRYRECQGLEGKDGLGAPMTPLQIKTAIKIHQQSADKVEDYDLLAMELELDINEDADMLIDQDSPTGTRQILRKYNIKDQKIPISFSDMTTPTPNQKEQLDFSSSRFIGQMQQ